MLGLVLALLSGFLLATPRTAAVAAPLPVVAPTTTPTGPSSPVSAPPDPISAPRLTVGASTAPARIVVRHGDTVWALSLRFHTTVAVLARLNHLADPARIQAGAILFVPGSGDVARPIHADPPAVVATPAADQPTTHQVAAAVFGAQFDCAAAIITRESGWNARATNPSSGAYGLGQALPGAKMAAAGPDWRTNPVTQLRWMRDYVSARYGGACPAWTFWQAHHWY